MGQSAWLVFSMMGYYPVCPGTPNYVLGSPSFEEITLHLPNGKTFKIVAKGNSAKTPYIQSARLNGRIFTQNFITHQQIMAGGTLLLKMRSQKP
jgi:putative alpha-1,2-mannosidase